MTFVGVMVETGAAHPVDSVVVGIANVGHMIPSPLFLLCAFGILLLAPATDTSLEGTHYIHEELRGGIHFGIRGDNNET